MSMNKSKKAQMEMMGLAVIVILLALGMYFMTKFTLLSGDNTQKVSERESAIATSFLNTLLTTQANCSMPITFGNLLDEITNTYSNVDCGGYESEALQNHLRNGAEDILNKTLGRWDKKKRYEFSVTFPPNSGISNKIIIGSCINAVSIDASPPFPVPSRVGGNIILKLKICS